MKNLLFCIALILSSTAFSQKVIPSLNGTWKAVSKIETETKQGIVTEEDKEIYKAGEKTYTFTSTNVRITQGFGKHTEKLPLRVQANKLFIGKPEKNKEPYIITTNGKRLILTKTERKLKKGKSEIETEVVTLEK
ncbi:MULTISPECIES: hypothetical protein [Chryseobacterium]|uniref:hypothetical protein n=1 Tax=Chryseobacterium TaxID=59732 RepID=UPI001BE7BDDB|nr:MULTISPECIES: hypothetical protein [Chryseobacterium]MBT2623498.1 hypothetical protein [Chryseobacterium sp. ISL-6]